MFTYLSHPIKTKLLRALGEKEVKSLLSNLNPDDRTDLLEEMSTKVAHKLLQLLTPEDRHETRTLLGFPLDSVGREMTPDYITVQSNWTVKKAMAHIREYGKEKETISMIYIIDFEGRLIGYMKLKYLIFADPKSKIKEVAKKGVYTASISAFADKEKAVALIKKLNIVALPVVDNKNILLGIVTIDDLLDIDQEEVTEDFHKMGGVSVGHGGDLSLSNLSDAPLNLLYRKRISWLIILVGVNVFSGAIIAIFEGVITKSVALVFFLPLLIGSGGNAGSQSAMLMVRALGTGDVKMHDWARMFGKEFFVAIFLGITMAVGVSFLGWVRGGTEIGVVVALSMLAVVIIGSLTGMLLPFIFTKFNKDPATASGPLITSIADICGVLIYLSIAKWYLGL